MVLSTPTLSNQLINLADSVSSQGGNSTPRSGSISFRRSSVASSSNRSASLAPGGAASTLEKFVALQEKVP